MCTEEFLLTLVSKGGLCIPCMQLQSCAVEAVLKKWSRVYWLFATSQPGKRDTQLQIVSILDILLFPVPKLPLHYFKKKKKKSAKATELQTAQSSHSSILRICHGAIHKVTVKLLSLSFSLRRKQLRPLLDLWQASPKQSPTKHMLLDYCFK